MKSVKLLSIILAAAFMVSGCSQINKPDADAPSDTGTETSASGSFSEITIEDLNSPKEESGKATVVPAASEEFIFEPHIHTDLLSQYVTEDMWDSLHNMVDAIRAGEDTFECSSEKAYTWCTYEVTVSMAYPPACTLVEGDGYAGNVAKLKYNMDKDSFRERCAAFENAIETILNEATSVYHSDFEKLTELYVYMCKYWVYDNDETAEHTCDNFGCYACLMNRDGICSEVAYALTYLLLQAGVEATPYGASCNHDWVYVVIGGNGYHVDPTWSLHGEMPDGMLLLENFMMTEEDRINDGFDPATFQVDFLWGWKSDYDLSAFSATDETFAPIRYGMAYKGIDTERNVLIYETYRWEIKELSYGDM